MQITTGLRRLLSNPLIYSVFQYMMGAKKGWTYLADAHIRANNGDYILDIGCGPADIVGYLPKVNYWGFDISEAYILKAKSVYGDKANFKCKYLTIEDIQSLPEFDIVVATGVLHHMDDDVAIEFLDLAFSALKPGGRLVTVDPCYVNGQNPIARFLISKDRGQNVRSEAAYAELVSQVFKRNQLKIKHKAFVPYTHCYIECTKR